MKKILIVEDEFTMHTALQYLLETAGYEVDGARDSHEASARLAMSTYHLAIVDLGLPNNRGKIEDCSGIQLLRWMEQQYSALPVIVLTIRDDPDTIQKCQKLGNVREYVIKDPNPDLLKMVVKKLLGGESPQPGRGEAHAS